MAVLIKKTFSKSKSDTKRYEAILRERNTLCLADMLGDYNKYVKVDIDALWNQFDYD